MLETRVANLDPHTFTTRSGTTVDCDIKTLNGSMWGNAARRLPNQLDPQPGAGTAGSGAYTDVAAGSTHTCAIRTRGTIVCWGSFRDIAPQGTYTAVAAGLHHGCAIQTDDTIACWGPKLPPEGVHYPTS